MFVIRDKKSKEYYRQWCGPQGWYSPELDYARIYSLRAKAQQTIDQGNHHVTYPGNRDLEIVPVELNINE